MSIVTHRFSILLIEDDPANVEFVRMALKEDLVPADLHCVEDGVEALEFLRREGPRFAAAPRPDLVLLDLTLPRLDGRDLLPMMKRDPALSEIPVIVLSGTGSEQDIAASYRSGAAGYIVKPPDVCQFMAGIRQLCEYWIMLMRLPQRQA